MDKQYAIKHNLSVDCNRHGKIMVHNLIDDVEIKINENCLMFLPSTVEALINEIIYLEKIIDGHNETHNVKN